MTAAPPRVKMSAPGPPVSGSMGRKAFVNKTMLPLPGAIVPLTVSDALVCPLSIVLLTTQPSGTLVSVMVYVVPCCR